MRIIRRSRRGPRARSRGQSLAELALVLPVILLIVMVALDFGRAFFSWVTITNTSRVAASYAAMYPTDWNAGSTYATLVQNEAANAICPVANGTYNPVFIDGPDAGASNKDFGDSVTVAVRCPFRILTPVIGSVLGSNLQMTASSTFPIRVGIQ